MHELWLLTGPRLLGSTGFSLAYTSSSNILPPPVNILPPPLRLLSSSLSLAQAGHVTGTTSAVA